MVRVGVSRRAGRSSVPQSAAAGRAYTHSAGARSVDSHCVRVRARVHLCLRVRLRVPVRAGACAHTARVQHARTPTSTTRAAMARPRSLPRRCCVTAASSQRLAPLFDRLGAPFSGAFKLGAADSYRPCEAPPPPRPPLPGPLAPLAEAEARTRWRRGTHAVKTRNARGGDAPRTWWRRATHAVDGMRRRAESRWAANAKARAVVEPSCGLACVALYPPARPIPAWPFPGWPVPAWPVPAWRFPGWPFDAEPTAAGSGDARHSPAEAHRRRRRRIR